jgi:glycosyltransferase involved in cell wall biosynthesis
MKIFHIITSLKIGGAESALVNFLHVANNNPHEHVVAYFYPGPNVQRLEACGIPTYHIKGIVHYADPVAFWRLARLIKQTQPNLIHSALWAANIVGRVMAKYFALPIICDVHGNSFDEGKLRNWFDRKTVGFATKIVAVSSSTHEAYCTNIIAATKNTQLTNNLITINNGIDYQATRLRAQQYQHTRIQLGLHDDDFVVGTIGRLEPIKSYDVLIKAFTYITAPNVKLVIVGGGSQEQALKHLCTELGITTNVLFMGYRTDATSFYPLFDCFVLSSQSEGLSIALLEALCFGLPIITTNQTSQHDVIEHNVHGLMVPPNNPQALAHAIKCLFENKEQRVAMCQACLHLVQHKFSLTSTINAYHEVYRNVVMNFSHKNKAHL